MPTLLSTCSTTFPFPWQRHMLQKLVLTSEPPPQPLELSSAVFLKDSRALSAEIEVPDESAG